MEKRSNYVVVCDKQFEDGLNDVNKVLVVNNLGKKFINRLFRQVSCIQGVASDIEETYGLSYEEILEVLQDIFGYTIINKSEMIEPSRYAVIDTFYNWELYAQNSDYAKESDIFITDNLKDKLTDLMNTK